MLTCKKAFQARDCINCRNAPINQMGKPSGQPISPTVKDGGKCAAYVGVPAKLAGHA